MRRSSSRAKQHVNYNEDADDITKPTKASAPISGKTKAPADPKPISGGKRKAEAEPDSQAEPAAPVVAAGAPKKRTKKEKNEDTMPLADRTAVSSLKKAMYIGAHVSAAGGMCYS